MKCRLMVCSLLSSPSVSLRLCERSIRDQSMTVGLQGQIRIRVVSCLDWAVAVPWAQDPNRELVTNIEVTIQPGCMTGKPGISHTCYNTERLFHQLLWCRLPIRWSLLPGTLVAVNSPFDPVKISGENSKSFGTTSGTENRKVRQNFFGIFTACVRSAIIPWQIPSSPAAAT